MVYNILLYIVTIQKKHPVTFIYLAENVKFKFQIKYQIVFTEEFNWQDPKEYPLPHRNLYLAKLP